LALHVVPAEDDDLRRVARREIARRGGGGDLVVREIEGIGGGVGRVGAALDGRGRGRRLAAVVAARPGVVVAGGLTAVLTGTGAATAVFSGLAAAAVDA
jgi:hypothetical protein